jgi:hypothetical protein
LRRYATTESLDEDKFSRRYATQSIFADVVQSLKEVPKVNCRYAAKDV